MPEYLKCPQCHEDLSFEQPAVLHGRLEIGLDGLATEDWQDTNATGPSKIYCKMCKFVVPESAPINPLTYVRVVGLYLKQQNDE